MCIRDRLYSEVFSIFNIQVFYYTESSDFVQLLYLENVKTQMESIRIRRQKSVLVFRSFEVCWESTQRKKKPKLLQNKEKDSIMLRENNKYQKRLSAQDVT